MVLVVLIAHVGMSLPSLPSGKSLRLFVPGYGGGYGTGGNLWPAASALCTYLSRGQSSLEGLAVCELGSGTGAVGLYAAALGAHTVCLSDISPALCQTISDNAAANRALFAANATVVSRTYTWGRPTSQLGGPFDLVLGSDVTYRHGMHRSLCKSVAELLSGGKSCHALLAHQHRPIAELLNGVDTLSLLGEAAATAGLEIRTVHSEQTLLPLSRISLLEARLIP